MFALSLNVDLESLQQSETPTDPAAAKADPKAEPRKRTRTAARKAKDGDAPTA
jgi:hypothetical protein